MKKDYLYAIIVTLLIVVISLGVYIATIKGDKSLDEEQKKEETALKDNVEFSSIKKEGDGFKEIFNININGSKKILEVDFSIKKDEMTNTILGLLGNETVYSHEHYDLDGLELTEDYIKENFNMQNFKFIKGEDDNSYLVVLLKELSSSGPGYYIAIFNDEMKKINGDTEFAGFVDHKDVFMIATPIIGMMLSEDVVKPWYEDDFGICNDSFYSDRCTVFAKPSEDKIKFYKLSKDYDNLEEYFATVKNSKLIIKKTENSHSVKSYSN